VVAGCAKISHFTLEIKHIDHTLVYVAAGLSESVGGVALSFYVASYGEYSMNSIDLTPLYRSSVGFDRLASMLDNASRSETSATSFPPYNIEILDDNRYAVTLAVAGFSDAEIDIQVERGVLLIRGEKEKSGERKFLHQGIANRTFERKFNLADHVNVTAADLRDGLLTISLLKEIPEAMKPQKIAINGAAKSSDVLEHQASDNKAA
tara:strand:+ start:302 stop:922 length:621 start_codon:yes stop_codon:yes gene_type:complete